MVITYFIHRHVKRKPAYGAYLAFLKIIKAYIWIIDVSNVVSVPICLAIRSRKRLLNRHNVGYNLHLFAGYACLFFKLTDSACLITLLVIFPTLWEFPLCFLPICFTFLHSLLQIPRFTKLLKVSKRCCLFRLCVLRVS